MASRMIHLAIACRLADKLGIKDRERFLLGQLLPDAYDRSGGSNHNGHYEAIIDNGTMKIYDFASYYNRYSANILSDGLYLGYYFHLIEDSAFRKYSYYDLGLLPLRGTHGFIDSLYADYHSINGYLCRKYGIAPVTEVPDSFESEEINEICAFVPREFLLDM